MIVESSRSRSLRDVGVGVTEADIADADPRFEFEEEDQDAINTEAINDEKNVDIVVIDGPELKEVAGSEFEGQTE